MPIKPDFKLGAAMPQSVGACADLYKEVQTLRLAMQKATDAMKAREAEIKEHIIDNLSKRDETGAAGKRYRAQVVRKVQAQLADWDKFTAFVVKHGRFDMLQKRLSDTAVKDLWENGFQAPDGTVITDVPGVEKFHAVDVSITKI